MMISAILFVQYLILFIPFTLQHSKMSKLLLLVISIVSLSDAFLHKNLGNCGSSKFSDDLQHPWMAFVVNKRTNSTAIGALISVIHVATHATAIGYYSVEASKFFVFHPSEIEVQVGLHFEYRIRRNAAKFVVHPEISEAAGENMKVNNVAVVTMHAKLKFDDYENVRPICLWFFNESEEKEVMEKSEIYSIGFGKSEALKYTKVSIIDQKVCKENYKNFVSISFFSTKTFCVAENSCATNQAISIKFDGKWYLRGIYSKYLRKRDDKKCLLDKPILYEDLAQHTPFLQCSVSEGTKKVIYQ